MADDPRHQTTADPPLSLRLTTAALLALAQHGVPADVQEALVRGDPASGIPPGALREAAKAAALAALNEAWEILDTTATFDGKAAKDAMTRIRAAQREIANG